MPEALPQIAIYALNGYVTALVGAWLFAWLTPTRPHSVVKTAAVVAISAIGCFVVAVIYWSFPDAFNATGFSPLSTGLLFALTFLAVTITVRVRHEMSYWMAIFCTTMSFSMWNISIGVDALLSTYLHGIEGVSFLQPAVLARDAACTALVYCIAYRLMIRRMRSNGLRIVEDHRTIAFSAVVVLAAIEFNILARSLAYAGDNTSQVLVFFWVVYIVVCIYSIYAEYQMLFKKALETDVNTLSGMLAKSAQQYETSRQTINAINRRVHDIRHQIWRLGTEGDDSLDRNVLKSISDEVNIFNAQAHTGNEALDTILTEKSLLASTIGVTLTYIADGSALTMEPVDTYSVVEAVINLGMSTIERIGDKERHTISLDIRQRGSISSIHLECDSPEDTAIAASDTSTVLGIVEKYGGTLAFRNEGDILCFDVIIPT